MAEDAPTKRSKEEQEIWDKTAPQIEALLKQITPPSSPIRDMETTKAVMTMATSMGVLPSTTNITKVERWEVVKYFLMWYYTQNNIWLMLAYLHMDLNRSLSGRDGANVLDGLFGLSRVSESQGMFNKARDYIGNR